jgi:hypothetical protein
MSMGWVLAVAVLGLALWVAMRRRAFMADIVTREAAVAAGGNAVAPCNDLPPEVMRLAERQGATGETCSAAHFSQTGEMWNAPGGRPLRFRARQVVAGHACRFVWRADFEPLSLLTAVDFLVGPAAGLLVRLLGVVPVVQIADTADVRRGQMQRYLAELPWAPDAILTNHDLSWSVPSPGRLVASAGQGEDRVGITFDLGDDGLVATAHAEARPKAEGNQVRYLPWGGRFWDYQLIGGRKIPMQAEVWWVIDGRPFIYWRGHLQSWKAGA